MKFRLAMAFVIMVTVVSVCGGIEISAGVIEGCSWTSVSTSVLGSEVDSKSQLMAAFGAYLDATYARLILGYAFNAGKPRIENLGEIVDHNLIPDNYWITRIDIMLLGKYPFVIGPVTLWPAAGLEYGIVLILNEDGDRTNDLSSNPAIDMNDLHIVAGFGLDYSVDRWTLSPSLLVALDLFPSNIANPPPEVSYFGFGIRFSLSLGYTF